MGVSIQRPQAPTAFLAPESLGHGDGDRPAQSRNASRIIDIRQSLKEESLVGEIRKGLDVPDGVEKRLPTLLLYSQQGLKLFEDITYLEEYYLTNTEIALLEAFAASIAEQIPDGAILVELGSGNLRKIDILLRAIDARGKNVEYYALDLSLPELERTLDEVPLGKYEHVQCFGLLGTYDDGLELMKTSAVQQKTKWVVSLGSSIGNFTRPDAAMFLKGFMDALGPQDRFLISIDSCKDPQRVYNAYNDFAGVTHQFIRQGLLHANEILGKPEFRLSEWDVIGEYDEGVGRHHVFVSPRRDMNIVGVRIAAKERVRIEESYKYSQDELDALWTAAGIDRVGTWSSAQRDYAMHLIAKPKHALPWAPKDYAATAAPTLQEWAQLWQLWDTVSRDMIPEEELLQKPIKLRNACIFYLGHIPGFFDIKLTQTFPEEGPTHPAHYHQIFERGIDPDVDNPEQCHAHSEIPDTWPPLEEMLAYQERVRQRVKDIYDRGDAATPKGARCLWLGYEHEAMHLETLLYMLVQSDKTRPPSATPEPIFSTLAEQDASQTIENQWFSIPDQDIIIGMDDPETESGPPRYFGWDIEKPPRRAHVKAFQAKARPITNGEYAEYIQQTGKETPASWKSLSKHDGRNGLTNGVSSFVEDKAVRTVWGDVPLKFALNWPVAASYDELSACATFMGGRIPTIEEARSIYRFVELNKEKAAADGRTIPAVNNHLINNGVPESPPPNDTRANGSLKATVGKLDPSDLFVDLKGCNVGFQKWTPDNVAKRGDKLGGQGDFGGLWEWTSTAMMKPDGFEPMPLYPAFSADFFDGKHNIVLGGSWATVPRIAGRKSFVNWYQRNYPYVWAGARIVRDVQGS